MSNAGKELNSDLKFGLKSFITICSILLGIMIFVGILTFIVPAGQYLIDEKTGNIIPNSFSFIKSDTTLPVWRWFTAPIEALLFGSGNFNIVQIIAVLLVLGGTFKVLDKAGLLVAIVHIVVDKFYEKRYLLIWIITLVMMLLASCFGLQEELLILFPIFLAMAKAMGWSKEQAVSLILITTGVGFTTAMFNPFTVGVASDLAEISVLDGLWFRFIMFVVLYFFTCIYLTNMAKKDEKQKEKIENDQNFTHLSQEEKAERSVVISSNIPSFLKGMPITLVTAGLLSIAFMGFSGMSF